MDSRDTVEKRSRRESQKAGRAEGKEGGVLEWSTGTDRVGSSMP